MTQPQREILTGIAAKLDQNLDALVQGEHKLEELAAALDKVGSNDARDEMLKTLQHVREQLVIHRAFAAAVAEQRRQLADASAAVAEAITAAQKIDPHSLD